LKRSGSKGNYRYSLNGKALDLNATDAVSNAVQSGAFDGHPDHKPREIMQAALNLSRKRAEAVRNSILEYAKTKKITIDASQIQPVGVGIREPFIAKPNNMDDARQNMRVEFRLLKVSAEVSNTSDFDF
jgi:outer membrane protein OmpA-like peptidoglycan-associated protein